MKPLVELDHYEVLEISPGASPGEIERAYHVARTAYGEGSLATYSVFGDHEVEALRSRIERAYQVLRDPAQRREYDQSRNGAAGHPDPFEPFGDDAPPPAPLAPLAPPPALRVPAPQRELPLAVGADPVEAEGGEYDGARLRSARLRRGLEIEDLATITKINPRYLRCLEEEALDQLPAAVYVQGFVRSFARCVGLDPTAAVTGYMARFEQRAPARKRGRILGRS